MIAQLRGAALFTAWLTCTSAAHALASCSASANATAFGSYSPFGAAPTDSTGSVRVQCSLLGLLSVDVSYTIALSPGSSGSFASRRMSSGAGTLAYNLYADAARTAVWGDSSGASASVADGYLLGLLTVRRDYPVYGRIAAGQNVPPGNYVDVITVTVNY
jgi:spore coat protein U-like protein